MNKRRYIINHNPDGSPTIHDRTNLDERCNVDDIDSKHKGETGSARTLAVLIREGFEPCLWCFGQDLDTLVPPPAEDPGVTA